MTEYISAMKEPPSTPARFSSGVVAGTRAEDAEFKIIGTKSGNHYVFRLRKFLWLFPFWCVDTVHASKEYAEKHIAANSIKEEEPYEAFYTKHGKRIR